MSHADDKFEYPVQKSDQEWKEVLTPQQYQLLRRSGTEPGGTGKFLDHFEKGVYRCAGCDQILFNSDQKFESGSGWPSWWKPASDDRVRYLEDRTWGMRRVEVVCSGCGGHLGHVFDDGPTPTGQRY